MEKNTNQMSEEMKKASEDFTKKVMEAAQNYVMDITKACIKIQESDDYDNAIAEYESSIGEATTNFMKSTTEAQAEYAGAAKSETKEAYEMLAKGFDMFSSIMF